MGKIERRSESVQWGKLFQVLEGLNIRLLVDVPESVAAHEHSLGPDTSSLALKVAQFIELRHF